MLYHESDILLLKYQNHLMALYFDILPLELREELLFRLPVPYLLGHGYSLEFEEYIFNIMDLESFKLCDNDYFWKSYYENYSSRKPYDKSYKDAFKQAYVNYVSNIRDNLYYAARCGHDYVLEQVFDMHPCIKFDYDGLFLVAAENLQRRCMRLIEKESELDMETYRVAIDNILYRNCHSFDALAPQIERNIEFLLRRGAIFPNIDYTISPPKLIRVFLDHNLLTEKFVDFIIKYSPNLNKKEFLKHLTVNHLITSPIIIKYFVGKTQTVITEEIFQHAVKYGTCIAVKTLLELEYHPTRCDTKLAKNYYNIDQTIMNWYQNKTLKRKRILH